MTSKSRKILGVILIVLALIPISNAVKYFTSPPILVGYSENKDWKVEYVSTGHYWEAQLFPLKQGLGQPENLVFIEGNQRNEYPGKGSKNEEPNDARLYYYCNTLGSSPKDNVSYKFEFISNNGQKQMINLKRQKEEFSIWKIF
ncbi:hypothetical protein MHH33_09050 [Paenisporosarcina sp. FSL H8-0542]|uniref:hypothetical protein n=1 Tax=unclassified Paenisporosarcina TaxID=2642018 RepID=UPI00034E2BBA|nr:hypothetical protein [Paenisporosarcina sp. HGH0030]EPD53797.1 hypothetical protein HMPREF1210_00620 [Paenisporosarcina sp. HGH0030]